MCPADRGQRASGQRRQLGKGMGQQGERGVGLTRAKAGRSAEVTHGGCWIPELQETQEGCGLGTLALSENKSRHPPAGLKDATGTRTLRGLHRRSGTRG